MSKAGQDEGIRAGGRPTSAENGSSVSWVSQSPDPHVERSASVLRGPAFTTRPIRPVPLSPERCAAVLGTVREIGTASADVEGSWRLLDCLSKEVKAEQAVLILCNPLTKALEFVVYNQDPTMPKLYADYYCDLDPTRLPEFVRGERDMPGDPAQPTVVSDLMEAVDYRVLLSTEFYTDFMKRGNIHHDLVAFMASTPLARGALCVHRARNNPPFSREEASLLDFLAPFVANHLEKMVSASLVSALQTGEDKGVILCDTEGRVLYCNTLARDLCSPLGPARGAPGSAQQGNGSQARRGAALAPLQSGDPGVASFVGYALSDPGALADNCNVIVSSRTVTLDRGSPGLLITVAPPEGYSDNWNEPLKQRFALTDREIEVLERAMAGGSNRDIAGALFIAECTVKKHMQNIATKVGARSRTAIAHTVRRHMGLAP